MKLIAVTDDSHSVEELASIIIQIKDVVDYVHIRERTKTCSEIISLLNLLKEGNVMMEKIVLNDRLDVALLMNIANVQLPGHSLPSKDVKEKFPTIQVGRSVHSIEEAKQAEREKADYVLYGHCYETNCKKGKAPNGINNLIEMKKELQIPVYAIGGITPDLVKEIRQAKADGIAVMSGIFSSSDPLASAIQFYERCLEQQ
ncbi:thiazole tautomerase TenI [Bacillus sp. RG28]|uniref:Thiazole tautomerase TenI n=1 Tax=Gottfriedia endophytica TaxID=2820819 RepID=A0A940NRB2_9BACI|nr:thiazole tautomerase TenI [Gottfriedia endophytica]MBP0726128.1 thiazole tautomerase TenI [Gottfriedia endophytica]